MGDSYPKNLYEPIDWFILIGLMGLLVLLLIGLYRNTIGSVQRNKDGSFTFNHRSKVTVAPSANGGYCVRDFQVAIPYGVKSFNPWTGNYSLLTSFTDASWVWDSQSEKYSLVFPQYNIHFRHFPTPKPNYMQTPNYLDNPPAYSS